MPLNIVLIAFLLLAPLSLRGQTLETGTFAADFTAEAWTLNAGAGSRTHILFVRFSQPFTERPAVLLSLTTVDGAAGKDGNIRVSVGAQNITREGFVLAIRTWSDSRVTGVGGQWLAVLEGPY